MNQQNILEIMTKVFKHEAAFIIDDIFWVGTQLAACVAYGPTAKEYRRSLQNIHNSVSFGVSGTHLSKEEDVRIQNMNQRLFHSGIHPRPVHEQINAVHRMVQTGLTGTTVVSLQD